MAKSNDLRMPFAEWLYRMSEKEVPYQARALAVYAVTFKIVTNEELARLTGMDTKGVADKTYNKWKSYLCTNGWVIVKQVKVGRTRTTEIYPALADQPVTFTDIKPKDASKFYGNGTVESTVSEQVETTPDAVKVTDESAQDAPAAAPAYARYTTRATKESPSEISSYEEASKLASAEPVAANGLAGLNGSAAAMIADIVAWLNYGDERNARQWLTTTLHTFGQRVTAESYQKLKTDIAEGAVIARPLQTWSKIAQRMKADPKSVAAPKDTSGAKRERIAQWAREEEERLKAEKSKWSART